MKTHHGKEQHCPYCNGKINAHTHTDTEEAPNCGDRSVCFECAGLLVFDDKLLLRKPTEKEREEMERDQSLLRLLRSVKERHEKSMERAQELTTRIMKYTKDLGFTEKEMVLAAALICKIGRERGLEVHFVKREEIH